MAENAAARKVFEAYLETSSGGNVEAEFSFFVDRIKLRCRKCQATKTYDGSFPAYVNEGTLDWGLQQWVKEHAHKEPFNYNDWPIINAAKNISMTHIGTLPNDEWQALLKIVDSGLTNGQIICGGASLRTALLLHKACLRVGLDPAGSFAQHVEDCAYKAMADTQKKVEQYAKPRAVEDDALPTNWNHLPKKKGLPTAASVPKFKDVPKLPSVGPITPLGGPEGKPKPLKTTGRKIR